MDIYQILIKHNRVWTIREIVCFSVLFVIASIIVFRLVHRKKIIFSQAIAGLLLLIFLGIVFGSTVFTREPMAERKYVLELFWSWKAVFRGSKKMLEESLLNCILLFPMGMLLPLVFHKKVAWWKGLMAGTAVSAGIELCQLIFCRGFFEFDDIIHNSIGCMAGCVTMNLAEALFGRIFVYTDAVEKRLS